MSIMLDSQTPHPPKGTEGSSTSLTSFASFSRPCLCPVVHVVLLPAAAASKRQAEQGPMVLPLCQDRVWGSSRHRSTDSQLPTRYFAAAAAGQRGAWHLCTVQVRAARSSDVQCSSSRSTSKVVSQAS